MNNSKKPGLIRRILFGKVTGSYESELKITLVLILLFLSIISIGSLRVVDRLADLYRDEHYRTLEYGADRLIDYISEDVSHRMKTTNFKRILSGTSLVEARFENFDLAVKTPSVDSIRDYQGRRIREYVARLNPRNREQLLEEGILRAGFGVGKDTENVILFKAFDSPDDRRWLGMFIKNAPGLKLVQTIAGYNYFFQLAGIVGILLIAYAYLKLTLNPFRRIATEARKLKTVYDMKAGETVEQVVETFRQTIARLEENEEKLKELYNNSQRRADRLEHFNQFILESMLSGLIGINRQGKIIHLNRSARAILELDDFSANDENYEQLLAGYPFIVDTFRSIMTGQSTVERMEQKLIQKTGEEKVLGLSGSPVYDHNSRMVGAILLLADLTEVRRLQNEIAFKEKMAAVGEMSAGLAHELRNAMMAIVGYGKYLTKISEGESQTSQIAESIRTEADNCETMLKRFLTFARPVAFTPENVDLKELLTQIIQKLGNLAKKKAVLLTDDFSEKSIEFTSDRVALDQIFTNLIKNAVEAAPENGQVDVLVRNTNSQDMIVIKIIDNGPGIEKEQSHKIFSPFFTTKEQGTGLGLSIVKKLVNGLGGTVEIDTSENEKTAFVVTLKTGYRVQTANSAIKESNTKPV
jgi:PAS domain S-box-containing protein